MLLSDAVTEFMTAKLATNCRAKTLKLYSEVLSHVVAYLYIPQIKITTSESLKPSHLISYSVHRGRKVKASTLAMERAIILNWVNWMMDKDLTLKCNWYKEFPRPKQDWREPRFLTADECRKLLIAAKSVIYRRESFARVRDFAIVSLLLDTGIRRNELLSIKIGDVDFKSYSIKISANSKSRRERWVFFGNHTAKALKDYLRHRGEVHDEDWLWVTRGRQLSGMRIYDAVKEISRAAGLKGVTVHSLRHTAATLLIKYRMNIADVQSLLGHSDVRITTRYIHLIKDEVRVRYKQSCPLDRLLSEKEEAA